MKTKTKKIFSLSVLVMCIAVFGLVGAVSAQTEPSIETILDNRYGSECWQNTTVETFLANGGGGMTATAIVVASECGYTNPTGWYVGGDSTAKTELWSDPESTDLPKAINTGGSFGLYIDSNMVGGEQVGPTYYTETSLNPSEGGESRQHAKVYQIGGTGCTEAATAADYVVAFEDKPYDDWDKDYNDVVIELQDTSAIPEFATIAIPAIAVLGLFLFFNRRKQRKE